jgi:hypothetical protein
VMIRSRSSHLHAKQDPVEIDEKDRADDPVSTIASDPQQQQHQRCAEKQVVAEKD